jgi:hypothetical protein
MYVLEKLVNFSRKTTEMKKKILHIPDDGFSCQLSNEKLFSIKSTSLRLLFVLYCIRVKKENSAVYLIAYIVLYIVLMCVQRIQRKKCRSQMNCNEINGIILSCYVLDKYLISDKKVCMATIPITILINKIFVLLIIFCLEKVSLKYFIVSYTYVSCMVHDQQP